MTHGGNLARLVMGARRYMGYKHKSIKPDKGLMAKSFGDPYLGWATFAEDVVIAHQSRTALPEETFPNYRSLGESLDTLYVQSIQKRNAG